MIGPIIVACNLAMLAATTAVTETIIKAHLEQERAKMTAERHQRVLEYLRGQATSG